MDGNGFQVFVQRPVESHFANFLFFETYLPSTINPRKVGILNQKCNVSVPIRFVEINRFCCAVDISNILHLVPNHNEGSGKIQTLR